MKLNPADHPLWNAIRLRDHAIKVKAHPKMIARLEGRVNEEARKAAGTLKPILSNPPEWFKDIS